jgi:hypothetical protein
MYPYEMGHMGMILSHTSRKSVLNPVPEPGWYENVQYLIPRSGWYVKSQYQTNTGIIPTPPLYENFHKNENLPFSTQMLEV